MNVKQTREEMLAAIAKAVYKLPTDELFGVKMYIDGYAARGDREDQKKQPEVKGA